MEEKALETMGENKASYMMKDMVSKVPASDQQDVKELKQGLGNAVGGGLQNPLGKFVGHMLFLVIWPCYTCTDRVDQAGNTADDVTAPLTGR